MSGCVGCANRVEAYDSHREVIGELVEALRIAKGELEKVEYESTPPDGLFEIIDKTIACAQEALK